MSVSVLATNDNRADGPEPTKKLLKISEVSELVGLSRSMIYKCISNSDLQFPPPVKIGAASRWLKDDIIDWSQQQAHR